MNHLLSRQAFLRGSLGAAATVLAGAPAAAAAATTASPQGRSMKMTTDWDKTFPKSGKIEHRKVTFKNRYGIQLAADLYQPKGAERQAAGDRRRRPVRRGEGTVIGLVCTDDG